MFDDFPFPDDLLDDYYAPDSELYDKLRMAILELQERAELDWKRGDLPDELRAAWVSVFRTFRHDYAYMLARKPSVYDPEEAII